VNREIRARLDSLRADYESVAGQPFEHFYCPVLFQDDDVAVCKGHLVSQAFGSDLGKWTVQRRDVDNFFGSRFEAEFTTLRYRDALRGGRILKDRKLRKNLEPRVTVDGREVEFYIPRGEIPGKFTAVYAGDDTFPPVVGLKMSPEEVAATLEGEWRVEVSADLRVSSLVSLLRAAHLTAFYLLGYRYALAPGGHFVGRRLLGDLFESARDLTIGEVKEHARSHLETSINMVRPVVRNGFELQGTLRDRSFFVAWSSSGFPWALIVFVPVGETMHSVMLPVGDDVESIATYHSFLSNENESIAVKVARYEPAPRGPAWELSKKSWRVHWPKGAGNQWADEPGL